MLNSKTLPYSLVYMCSLFLVQLTLEIFHDFLSSADFFQNFLFGNNIRVSSA